MKKTEILAMILKLAGFEKIKIETERWDGRVSYEGSAERKNVDVLETIDFQGENFETATANLLSVLYDTADINFEQNVFS